MVYSAGSSEEPDQPGGGVAALLDDRAPEVRGRRRVIGTEAAPQLGPDGAPPMQDRGGGQVGRSAPRPVPAQPLEVEHTGPKSEDPALDRARGNAALVRDGRHLGPVGEDARRRVDDNLDPSHLAGQCIPGEHTLPMTAVTAARERHRQRDERVGRLQPARDAAPGELELGAAAGRAAAAGKKIVAGIGEACGVAARLNVEYEDHVLSDGPGVRLRLFRGRRVSSAPRLERHPAANRARPPLASRAAPNQAGPHT